MHYFVTGHTGFKGSWLTLLLTALGHEVSGYSLAPVRGGLFDRTRLDRQVKHHYLADVRDRDALIQALQATKPDFAIHMAAQPLVLRSYEDPIETYTTNVDGTRNFLEAISALDSPPTSLIVTTDKVYRDDGKGSYIESDPLGGHDPYSASKAMADILSQSWSETNPELRIHIARAGNVIGAFDVSENRLIPDAIRSVRAQQPLEVRNPDAVRPWQHVLDCLSGYLLLLAQAGHGSKAPTVMNFGPDDRSIRRVLDVLVEAHQTVPELTFQVSRDDGQPKETQLLTLDSSRAKSVLNWENLIGFEDAVAMSFAELGDDEPEALVNRQIQNFLERGAKGWLA